MSAPSSAPQTLLAMAGAPDVPPPLSESAVVLIDAQREYLDGNLPLPGVEAALDQAVKLLTAARQAGRPVIHVRHKGKPGGLFDPETSNYAIAEPVMPVGDEAVVTKALPNSFAGTELHELLIEAQVKKLLVAGFMTHMCVSSTVRAATDLGYQTAVVAEACATRDLPDGRGGVVPAAELHRAELAALSDRFATIVATADEIPA
jgi:nicotinamidase-related amidase